MGFFQAFRMAVKSIVSNKVRSFLTMLGVIIGVGAVIAAVAIAQGSTSSITSRIQEMGTNLITITIFGRNSNRNVTYEQLQNLADENPSVIGAIAPTISGSVTVKVGSKTRSTTLMGTSDQYETIRSVHVQSGRFITPLDLNSKKRVALVGTAVVNDVFEGNNPLGKQIKINNNIFTVVGVLTQTANGVDGSDDDQVIIPVTVAQRLMRNAIIRNFSVQAATPESVQPAIDLLTAFLTKIYKSSDTFRVMSQEQMLDTLSSVTSTMMIVLGGIATVSLVVGGIGIMNIMLVSVTERTREIGIRKAIGAKRRNILVQFLIEALMVTGFGGVLGVLLGAGVIKFVIGGLNLAPAVYSVPWMTMSFCISLAVGVVFGLFPAVKAANLNPIEALRFE